MWNRLRQQRINLVARKHKRHAGLPSTTSKEKTEARSQSKKTCTVGKRTAKQALANSIANAPVCMHVPAGWPNDEAVRRLKRKMKLSGKSRSLEPSLLIITDRDWELISEVLYFVSPLIFPPEKFFLNAARAPQFPQSLPHHHSGAVQVSWPRLHPGRPTCS